MPESASSSEGETLYTSANTGASERCISTTDVTDASDDGRTSPRWHGKLYGETPEHRRQSSEINAERRNPDRCFFSIPSQLVEDAHPSGPSTAGDMPPKKIFSKPRNELRKLLLCRNSSFSAMTCRTLLEMKRAGRLDPKALPFDRKSSRTKYVCPEAWMKRNLTAGVSRTAPSTKKKFSDDPAGAHITSTSDRNSSREVSRCRSLSASPDEDASQVDENTAASAKSNDSDRKSSKYAQLREEACSNVAPEGTSLKFSFVPDDVVEMQRFYEDGSDAECCCRTDDGKLYPLEQDRIVKEVLTFSEEIAITAGPFRQNGINVSVKQEPLDADSAGLDGLLSTSDKTSPTNRRGSDDQDISSPQCSISNESASKSIPQNPVESENEGRSPMFTVCKEEPVSESEDADLQFGMDSDLYAMRCKKEIASDEALDSIGGKTRDMVQQRTSGDSLLCYGNALLHSAGTTNLTVNRSPERLQTSSGFLQTLPQVDLSCGPAAGDSGNLSPRFSLHPESFTFFIEPLSPQREALDLSLKGKSPPPTSKLWPTAAADGRVSHQTHANEIGGVTEVSSEREKSDASNEFKDPVEGISKESSIVKDRNGLSDSASEHYCSDESLSPGRLVIDLPTQSSSLTHLVAKSPIPTRKPKPPMQKSARRLDTKSFPHKPVKSGEVNGANGGIAWTGSAAPLRPSLAKPILRWPPIRMGQPWMQLSRPVAVGPRFATPANPQQPVWPQMSPSPVLFNAVVTRRPPWTQPATSTGRQVEHKGHVSWMRPSTSLGPAVTSSLPRIPPWVRYPIAVSAASIIPLCKSSPIRTASALAVGSQAPNKLPAPSTRDLSDSVILTSRASDESKSRTSRRASTSLQWRKFSRQYDESRNKTPRGTVHECQCCGRVFSCRSHKERHMLSHTGLKPHPCPVCLKGFRRKDDVKIHMLTHTGQRPHECKLCLKRFAHKGTLNKHMLIHSGLKPHKCNVCERNFRRREHLTVHMLTHTGEKPFECHVCHNRYRRRDLLKSHVLAHSGKKHFTCTECSRGFSHKSSLNYHMLTHTGVRPHQCDECHKRFTHKGNLNKHKLIHTKRKESEPTSFEVVCE